LALDGGQRLASRPGRFLSGKRNPSTFSTNLISGWVGHRVGLDGVVKRSRFPAPVESQTPGREASSPVSILTKLPWLLSREFFKPSAQF